MHPNTPGSASYTRKHQSKTRHGYKTLGVKWGSGGYAHWCSNISLWVPPLIMEPSI